MEISSAPIEILWVPVVLKYKSCTCTKDSIKNTVKEIEFVSIKDKNLELELALQLKFFWMSILVICSRSNCTWNQSCKCKIDLIIVQNRFKQILVFHLKNKGS